MRNYYSLISHIIIAYKLAAVNELEWLRNYRNIMAVRYEEMCKNMSFMQKQNSWRWRYKYVTIMTNTEWVCLSNWSQHQCDDEKLVMQLVWQIKRWFKINLKHMSKRLWIENANLGLKTLTQKSSWAKLSQDLGKVWPR